jgi:hypothetical protein
VLPLAAKQRKSAMAFKEGLTLGKTLKNPRKKALP